MDEQERAQEIARLWPRLREEAHDLYREVGTLRERIRRLERDLAGAQLSAASLQETNANLSASLTEVRARLGAIERSRGWRLVLKVRRLVRRGLSSNTEVPGPPPKPPTRTTKGPEPTFAQLRAMEAARRAEVAAVLAAWIESTHTTPAEAVIVLAGDRSETHTEAFIHVALSTGDPVCVLEADPDMAVGGIPPGIRPSLVPGLLGMDPGGKARVFVCTTPGHAAIRWIVPAQERGWATLLILERFEPSAALTYIASHVDAVIVGDEASAREVKALTGMDATVRAKPSVADVLTAARASPRALSRVVLGIG